MIAYFPNSITFSMTTKQARSAYHAGPCYANVEKLRQVKSIRIKLRAITDQELISALKPYGAWDDTELKDRKENELRFLWLAAAEIVETENL